MTAWWQAAALCASAGLGAWHAATAPRLGWTFAIAAIAPSEAGRFRTVLDHRPEAGRAHSPSIRLTSDGPEVMWFEGTRESHADVVIKRVRLGADLEAGPVEVLLRKEDLAAVSEPRQAVLSLGNAVQHGDRDDVVLATVVSLGGWAAASIAWVALDATEAPAAARKLTLSPFLGRSHLVRAPTVPYADGTHGIPAYFELGNAFGDLVRVDADGSVRDRRRMTHGRFAIQPVVVPSDGSRAVALLRNFDEDTDRLVAVWTEDGGRTWSEPALLDLPNPDAPVAALRLRDGRILMAFNDAPDAADTLRLAVSADEGRSWTRIRTLEAGGGDARYPAMARLASGEILLSYSVDGKAGIRAHAFDETWIDDP